VTGLTGTPADAAAAAATLDSGGFVTGADWTLFAGSAGIATPAAVADAPITSYYSAGSFLILSTGDATQADVSGGFADTAWGTTAHGGNDVTTLRVDVNLPANNDCIGFRYQFLTEEFPIYVGSYNDGFLAELDANTWSFSSPTLTKPASFSIVSDTTVNSAYLTAAAAAGSVYNGASGGLDTDGYAYHTATPGPHSIYFTVYDAVDTALDTAIFLSGLHYGVLTDNAHGGVCATASAPFGQVVIQRSVAGTHLVSAPGGFACRDLVAPGPALAVGATLAGPNPGVSCTPFPFGDGICRSTQAAGSYVAGGGSITITSACGPPLAASSVTLASPLAGVGPASTTTLVAHFPWTCRVTDAGATPAPALHYVAACTINLL
jgi:hypothetical protein